VIGAFWRARQYKSGLLGRTVALFVITIDAGTYQILPSVCAPEFFGSNMIHGHGRGHSAAILAAVTVPLDNIFAREEYSFTGPMDI